MSWLTSTFKIERPEDVSCTLTVTMSLKGWERVAKQMLEIREGYFGPVSELRDAISDLVQQARTEFDYNSNSDDEDTNA